MRRPPGRLRTELEAASLEHGGRVRTFHVHVPARLRADPMPVILALHGGAGTGVGMAAFTRLNTLAEHEGFLVAYADGVGGGWADGRGITDADRARVDDVGFASALIDHLVGTRPVDGRRVSAAGISNGGMMAIRLACELQGRIAAIAVVAASEPAALAARCAPARPTPLMLIHGTDDGLAPYGGGQVMGNRGQVLGARATAERWAELNGCDPQPTVERPAPRVADGTRVVREAFARPAESRPRVVLVTIEGGGHTWPGGLRFAPFGVLGRTSRNLDASKVIWGFFGEHGGP